MVDEVVILPAGVAEVVAAANAGLMELGEFIAEEARRNAPVGSGDDPHPGRLRDSIHVVRDVDGVTVVADAEEAIFNEFGTVNMPAHPFMTPAVVVGEAHAAAIVGGVMAETLR